MGWKDKEEEEIVTMKYKIRKEVTGRGRISIVHGKLTNYLITSISQGKGASGRNLPTTWPDWGLYMSNWNSLTCTDRYASTMGVPAAYNVD